MYKARVPRNNVIISCALTHILMTSSGSAVGRTYRLTSGCNITYRSLLSSSYTTSPKCCASVVVIFDAFRWQSILYAASDVNWRSFLGNRVLRDRRTDGHGQSARVPVHPTCTAVSSLIDALSSCPSVTVHLPAGALRSTLVVAELAREGTPALPLRRHRPTAGEDWRRAPIDPMLKYCLVTTGRSLRQVTDRQRRSSACHQTLTLGAAV